MRCGGESHRSTMVARNLGKGAAASALQECDGMM